ncbi:pmp superfamily [Amphidinium carterae]|eukprot:6470304-Amphidinium_carterae.2
MGFCNFCLSALCAYFIPPLGVYWRFGCGIEVVICTVLTLLCYVPGLLYAIIMIGCEDPSDKRSMPESPKAEGVGAEAA